MKGFISLNYKLCVSVKVVVDCVYGLTGEGGICKGSVKRLKIFFLKAQNRTIIVARVRVICVDVSRFAK